MRYTYADARNPCVCVQYKTKIHAMKTKIRARRSTDILWSPGYCLGNTWVVTFPQNSLYAFLKYITRRISNLLPSRAVRISDPFFFVPPLTALFQILLIISRLFTCVVYLRSWMDYLLRTRKPLITYQNAIPLRNLHALLTVHWQPDNSICCSCNVYFDWFRACFIILSAVKIQ